MRTPESFVYMYDKIINTKSSRYETTLCPCMTILIVNLNVHYTHFSNSSNGFSMQDLYNVNACNITTCYCSS